MMIGFLFSCPERGTGMYRGTKKEYIVSLRLDADTFERLKKQAEEYRHISEYLRELIWSGRGIRKEEFKEILLIKHKLQELLVEISRIKGTEEIPELDKRQMEEIRHDLEEIHKTQKELIQRIEENMTSKKKGE